VDSSLSTQDKLAECISGGSHFARRNRARNKDIVPVLCLVNKDLRHHAAPTVIACADCEHSWLEWQLLVREQQYANDDSNRREGDVRAALVGDFTAQTSPS
jgi:hypothetical protein